jgi:DNA helicase-2/ATP-dependent DNA helicase PcrA
VVNLVEDRFPTRRRGEGIEIPTELIHEMLPEGDYHIEEERRLFYVAATRAKDALYLTSADDYGGARSKKSSRFLTELGFNHIKKNEPKSVNAVPSEQLKKPSAPLESSGEFLYEFPKAFSFSQIKAYETCPYQYKLAHILKIPSKGNASFSFGQTIHNTLQKFYERIRELNTATQGSLFDSSMHNAKNGVQVPTLNDLLSLYDASWQSDWYQNKKQREEYYAKGKEILKLFYTAEDGHWTIPVALESWFKIKVGSYFIHGRIDRIDMQPDGTLEIIDYKTGKSKEKVAGEEKDQLLIYQIAAESLPEYRHIGATGKLTFYYVNDGIRTSFLGHSEELQTLKEKLEKTITSINSGNFAATPSQFICAHCNFRDVCEFRIL